MVSFDQFVMSLETLKVKFSSKDLLMVFKYLDNGQKGYIDYADFCNLSDERRMKIDPAQAMLKEYEETGQMKVMTGRG